MRRSTAWLLSLAIPLTGLIASCTAISVEPSCPATMQVGEIGELRANEQNPGGIPRYLWELFPSDRGSLGRATSADTTIQARKEGEIVARLTASDGLFQVVSECRIQVEGFVGVAVSLSADPEVATIGDPVTLTCESIGADDATTLAVVQTEGGIVELVEISEGVVRFEPDRIGDLEFRCVGETDGGVQSAPALLTVNVRATSNGNANQNANGNGNDNSNANTNDNTANTSSNENRNANDNER